MVLQAAWKSAHWGWFPLPLKGDKDDTDGCLHIQRVASEEKNEEPWKLFAL